MSTLSTKGHLGSAEGITMEMDHGKKTNFATQTMRRRTCNLCSVTLGVMINRKRGTPGVRDIKEATTCQESLSEDDRRCSIVARKYFGSESKVARMRDGSITGLALIPYVQQKQAVFWCEKCKLSPT